MPSLYSYIVRVDDGAAPNPFNGMCSLAICKPGIRKTAKEGDWIAGLGSVNAPSGDLSKRLIYAMRVEEKVTLEEYNRLAPERWPHRIPNFSSMALQDRLGDCLYYDFSKNTPEQRSGVHNENNIKTDLSGENVLISRDFYYFGRDAVPLPDDLHGIIHQGQGHRRPSNHSYFDPFVNWLRSIAPSPGQFGWPDFMFDWEKPSLCSCAEMRGQDDLHDPECE